MADTAAPLPEELDASGEAETTKEPKELASETSETSEAIGAPSGVEASKAAPAMQRLVGEGVRSTRGGHRNTWTPVCNQRRGQRTRTMFLKRDVVEQPSPHEQAGSRRSLSDAPALSCLDQSDELMLPLGSDSRRAANTATIRKALRRGGAGKEHVALESMFEDGKGGKLSDLSEEKLEKMRTHRNRVVGELVETEQRYVRGLEVIVTKYVEPIREKKILSQKEIATLFANVEVILPVNRELLHLLEEKHAKWDDEQCIGDAILSITPFLKLYLDYEKSAKEGEQLLSTLTATNPQFSAFADACVQEEYSNGLPLLAFLITPIQRLPRYQLLLQDLIKHTWTDHPDHPTLCQALDAVKKVAMELNNSSSISEAAGKVNEICNAIRGCPPLMLPHRFFIREGSLTSITKSGGKKSIVIHLFNDSILFSRKGQFRHFVDLGRTWVRDYHTETDAPNFQFEVYTPEVKYLVQAKDMAEKREWMAAILGALSDLLDTRPVVEEQRVELMEEMRLEEEKEEAKQAAKQEKEQEKEFIAFRSGVIRSGFLNKKGAKIHNWKRRYCKLEAHSLQYYADDVAVKPLGKIDLRGCECDEIEEVKEQNKGRFSFTVSTPGGRAYHFVCEAEEERALWVSDIQQQIKHVESTAQSGWLKKGWLEKKEKAWTGEKRPLKWWALDHHAVRVFDSDESPVEELTIPLSGLQAKEIAGDDPGFVLTRSGKSSAVATALTDSAEDAAEWVRLITEAKQQARLARLGDGKARDGGE